MKPVILYYSQTGFTEQYARWIAEELSCPCIPFERRDTVDFSGYDTVIFGSWFHAGQLKKVKWLWNMLPQWQEKRKIVFGTGASPEGSQKTETILKKLEGQGEKVKAFYLPGGLRYERMGKASRIMMKLFAALVNKKKNKTPEEEAMARMIRQSYDISGRKYILPVLDYIRDADRI